MEFILSFWHLLVSTKEKINFYQSNRYLVIREKYGIYFVILALISFTKEKINFYLSNRYLVIRETRALQAIIMKIDKQYTHCLVLYTCPHFNLGRTFKRQTGKNHLR